MKVLQNIFKIRESILLLINILLFIIFALIFPNFTKVGNILGIFYTVSINLIVAVAMTVLFVSGGFDISAGTMIGFGSALAGIFVVNMNLPVPLAISLIIIIGFAIGTLMGSLISYLNINPFFVTISGYFIIQAFIYILLYIEIYIDRKTYALIAGYRILGIPTIILFSIFLLIIFDVLLRNNVYFRKNFAIGNNEVGAVVSGINVKRIKMFNYSMVSTMAAIAGIFASSRYQASFQSTGQDSAFIIITAVIIGGASLRGGKGTVTGTFLGLFLLAMVYDSFVFMKLDPQWNRVAIGLILILVVFIDTMTYKERTIRLKA